MLTVGGRYTWEKKRWYGRQQTFIPALAGGFDPGLSIGEALDASVFNFPAGVIQVLDKANEPTYRASLGYQATDDLFVYATYRSEEHTSELQSLMRISYAVFCLKKK